MRVPIRKPGKYTHQKPDFHITQEKLEELQHKLEQLKKVSRPQTASEVQRLADMGDFSENAAYQMAKGRLRGINERILELEDQLNHAEIITPAKNAEMIQLGQRITIEIEGAQKTYVIRGSLETDPHKGIISYSSPMGAALMGRKVGDTVSIQLESKTIECKVLAIE